MGDKDIDMAGDKIKYYCFNKQCKFSIFSKDCIITLIPLVDTGEIQYCTACHKELISKEELNIKIQLSKILHEEKLFKSIIIDDDPIYHMVVKKLFEHSNTIEKHEHYMDGLGALDFLTANKNQPNHIPDIIFVDVNMPKMDAWEFLNEFCHIYPSLQKKIDVYVMTNIIQRKYEEKAKNYSFVKGIITKNFDLSFLNSLEV